MASYQKSINSVRTKLLIYINEELTSLKKNCKTKIQSRNLNEFEDLFYSSFYNIIQLKEESFTPQNYTREVVQEKKAIFKFLHESPDIIQLKFYKKKLQSSKEILLSQFINNSKEIIKEEDNYFVSKKLEKKSKSTRKNNFFKTQINDQFLQGK